MKLSRYYQIMIKRQELKKELSKVAEKEAGESEIERKLGKNMEICQYTGHRSKKLSKKR